MKNKIMLCAALLMLSCSSGLSAMDDGPGYYHYRRIMDYPWTSDMQDRVNMSWYYLDQKQKMDVLNRMAKQGLLSEQEVVNWNYNKIPKKGYGG